MSKTPVNFRIDVDLLARLNKIRDESGVPVAEQVRRALTMWLADPEVQRGHAFLAKYLPKGKLKTKEFSQ